MTFHALHSQYGHKTHRGRILYENFRFAKLELILLHVHTFQNVGNCFRA